MAAAADPWRAGLPPYFDADLAMVERIKFQKLPGSSSDAKVCVKWHIQVNKTTKAKECSAVVDRNHDAVDRQRRAVIVAKVAESRARRAKPEAGRRYDDVLHLAMFMPGSLLPQLRSGTTRGTTPTPVVVPCVAIGMQQVGDFIGTALY